ncbi:hypothetical protein M9H77_00490 [Catharanthus roseus]|nr:hypothetical protein M9H77_00490 [Catharanthus roseus]
MNRSNSSHVPLLPRLPLPHSMKDDGPNPLKMIKALEGVSSIYDNLTSVKKALNRSEKLCISPERGLQKAIRTDSLKIRPFSFSELNRAPLANTSSTVSPRIDHSPSLPSRSSSLNIHGSVQEPVIRSLGCIIMVSAIKLDLDPDVLMTAINHVLSNLPLESVRNAIHSGLFENIEGTPTDVFSSIIDSASTSSSVQDSARSTAIQPVPIDLESNPPEDLDIRSNGPKLLKWIIGASLLLVTLAAAKTSFN